MSEQTRELKSLLRIASEHLRSHRKGYHRMECACADCELIEAIDQKLNPASPGLATRIVAAIEANLQARRSLVEDELVQWQRDELADVVRGVLSSNES
jgi:hypothetical protein